MMIDGLSLSASVPKSHDDLAAQKVDRLESLVREGDLKKAGQEFEAYFLSYLYKLMRSTVPKGPLTSNKGGEVFQAFYADEIGKQAAQTGGIGLAQLIESSLRENLLGDSQGPVAEKNPSQEILQRTEKN